MGEEFDKFDIIGIIKKEKNGGKNKMEEKLSKEELEKLIVEVKENMRPSKGRDIIINTLEKENK